jgi:hypothetical protein
VHFLTDQGKSALDVAGGGTEGIGVDDQGGTQHNERRPVFRRADGLFEGEPAHRLNRHVHRFDDLAELIQWARCRFSAPCIAASLVIADVVDDVVAAQVFEESGGGNLVFAGPSP